MNHQLQQGNPDRVKKGRERCQPIFIFDPATIL